MIDLVETAKEVLKKGNTILVIGVTPGNAGEWYDKDDHRLVFWDGTDSRRKKVPSSTGLALFTRFTDHNVIDRVKSSMPKEGVFHSKPISSGELKNLLQSAWSPLPQKQSITNGSVSGESEMNSASAPSSAVVEESNPAKTVGNFVRSLPSLKKALDEVLQENFDLGQEVEHLQKILASSDELTSELGLYKEELAKMSAAHDTLKLQLGRMKEQVAENEDLRQRLVRSTELCEELQRQIAEKEEAVQRFMSVFNKPSS